MERSRFALACAGDIDVRWGRAKKNWTRRQAAIPLPPALPAKLFPACAARPDVLNLGFRVVAVHAA